MCRNAEAHYTFCHHVLVTETICEQAIIYRERRRKNLALKLVTPRFKRCTPLSAPVQHETLDICPDCHARGVRIEQALERFRRARQIVAIRGIPRRTQGDEEEPRTPEQLQQMAALGAFPTENDAEVMRLRRLLEADDGAAWKQGEADAPRKSKIFSFGNFCGERRRAEKGDGGVDRCRCGSCHSSTSAGICCARPSTARPSSAQSMFGRAGPRPASARSVPENESVLSRTVTLVAYGGNEDDDDDEAEPEPETDSRGPKYEPDIWQQEARASMFYRQDNTPQVFLPLPRQQRVVVQQDDMPQVFPPLPKKERIVVFKSG